MYVGVGRTAQQAQTRRDARWGRGERKRNARSEKNRLGADNFPNFATPSRKSPPQRARRQSVRNLPTSLHPSTVLVEMLVSPRFSVFTSPLGTL